MEFIRKKRGRPHIEIAPLVDIIFLLLIFFMISSNFIAPNIRMDLPKAMNSQKLEKVDLVVTADGSGNLYVNRQSVTVENLQHALQERMNRLNRYDVIFKGDEKIGYDLFVTVLDIARSAGATSFSVEHSQ